MTGIIVSANAVRVIVECPHGRVYLARENWTSERPPRRNMIVEINDRLEARIEPLRSAFSVAEITRG